MSDWQKGDLALCVIGGHRGGPVIDAFPEKGCIYTVEKVGISDYITGDFLSLWLHDAPRNSDGQKVWPADRFRKIRPSAIKHIEALKDVPLPVRENEHA